ncbi:cytochrome P450, partial [Tanacetum coccineum]
MKDVFAKYGMVEDVFIAGKRNKQGKRFGFARFKGVTDQAAFENILNTICIGVNRIRCNVAKFQRRPGGVDERLTWISISGLPTQLWLSKPFSCIAEKWGKVIIPEECNARQFNRAIGNVCFLTKRKDFIRDTVLVPVGKELVMVRVLETDRDLDSLFNTYLYESSSDDEEYSPDNNSKGDSNDEADGNHDKDETEDDSGNDSDSGDGCDTETNLNSKSE